MKDPALERMPIAAHRERSPRDERIEDAIERASYRFAKTAKNNPHWYTLRNTWADDAEFIRAVEYIRARGDVEYYYGTPYLCLHLHGMFYWTMGYAINKPDGTPYTILINRKTESACPSDAGR